MLKLIDRAYNIFRERGLLDLFKSAYKLFRSRLGYKIRGQIHKLTKNIPRKEGVWVMGNGLNGRERRGGNAKYLFLKLGLENPTVDFIWLSQNEAEITKLTENGYTSYKSNSLRGIYSLLRAEKVFCTNGMDFSWWLTGGAEIIQLWHGNALKKVGWDSIDHRGRAKEKLTHRKKVTYNWDKLVTTSINPPADVIRRAFDIQEESTMVTGYPRTDIFFNEIDHLGIGVDTSLIEILEHDIPNEATVFMYAPTWRRQYGQTEQTVLSESGINLHQLNKQLSKTNSYVVLKLHPKENIDVKLDSESRIFFAKSGSDPYPLLPHIDCLITDYSSLYIDYLILNRPIIFYPYDLEEYLSREGLYYNYDSITPGPVAKDSEELIQHIRQVSTGDDRYVTDRTVIRDLFYDHIDGKSSERIFNKLKPKSEG